MFQLMYARKNASLRVVVEIRRQRNNNVLPLRLKTGSWLTHKAIESGSGKEKVGRRMG